MKWGTRGFKYVLWVYLLLSFFFSFLTDLFIYLFIFTVLHLCCCIQAFSSCSKQGLLFVAVGELLVAVASLVAKHKPLGMGASVIVVLAL